jgi:dihydroorotate dehydrogenase
VLKRFHAAAAGRTALIGAGGVADGADAYAKIRAGARAVQLYSALVYGGPGLVQRIKRELAARLRAEGFASRRPTRSAPHDAATRALALLRRFGPLALLDRC